MNTHPKLLPQRSAHLVAVHLFRARQIRQLAVPSVGDVDAVRGDVSVDEALLVQEHDGRLHASRVEAHRVLRDHKQEGACSVRLVGVGRGAIQPKMKEKPDPSGATVNGFMLSPISTSTTKTIRWFSTCGVCEAYGFRLRQSFRGFCSAPQDSPKLGLRPRSCRHMYIQSRCILERL